MTWRPLILSGFEVDAVLNGRKTQHRALVKPQPTADIVDFEYEPVADLWLGNTQEDNDLGYCSSWAKRCPFGIPGDRLWVREAHITEPACAETGRRRHAIYRADGGYPSGYKWRSPVFMPRWAARLALAVVTVDIARLQEVTEQDARAMGHASLAEYLDSVAKKQGAEVTAANPWVWVVWWNRCKDKAR